MNETTPKYILEMEKRLIVKIDENTKSIDKLAIITNDRFNVVESRLDTVETKLDKIDVDLTGVDSRLDRLESDVYKIKDTIGKIEGHIGRYEIRSQNIEETLKQDHGPRIKELERILCV